MFFAAVGMRTNCVPSEFSSILDEETEQELKEAVQISMGTEISDDDISNIQSLSDQVIQLSEYRVQLYEYLQNRMRAIAPNLTTVSKPSKILSHQCIFVMRRMQCSSRRSCTVMVVVWTSMEVFSRWLLFFRTNESSVFF